MKNLVVFVLLASLSCLLTNSALSGEGLGKVFVKDGNIYFSPDGKEEIQLTNSGLDRAPVISFDSKLVAFIRKSNEEAYLAVGGVEDYTPRGLLADQVWIVNIDDKQEEKLVGDKHPRETNEDDVTKALEKTIAHIDDNSLCFSPDGRKVYFISSAWVTSGAVHSVNIDGSGEKFITGGNTLEVIDRGRYKGYLIIRQHKYFFAGGSYDWLWLVSPEGKQVGALGLDLNDDQRDFLYSDSIHKENE